MNVLRSDTLARAISLYSCLFSLVFLTGGCSMFTGPRHHEEVRSPETAVRKSPLPVPPSAVHRLEFDDRSDGSRMRPKNRTDLPVPTGGERTEDRAVAPADLRQKALANTAVRQLLGERFALINATSEDSGRKLSMGCCTAPPPRTRLTFYSYSNNTTVEIEMKGEVVGNVRRRDAYLPPEGEEEIQTAIALAQQDSRIAAGIQNLDGHAILMQPAEGMLWNDPGYGHRVFWVTFSQGLSGDPQYWAIVDLNDQKVLKADKEAPHP